MPQILESLVSTPFPYAYISVAIFRFNRKGEMLIPVFIFRADQPIVDGYLNAEHQHHMGTSDVAVLNFSSTFAANKELAN